MNINEACKSLSASLLLAGTSNVVHTSGNRMTTISTLIIPLS